MAETSHDLEGPDFEAGCEIESVDDGGMLLGHAFGEAILVARQSSELFAIGATCTHYGGPLAKGLMVDCTVRCPWHHAHFDLRTGEAIAGPALSNSSSWKIEKRGARFFVTGKSDAKPSHKPKSSPASVIIVGGGAAGGAAAEMLRREGYEGPVTLIGADEFLPYDRPNLSKDYLAGSAPEEWIPLRSADFYREQKIETLTNATVSAINPKTKQVTVSDGRRRRLKINRCNSTTERNWIAIWWLWGSACVQTPRWPRKRASRRTTAWWSTNFWRQMCRESLPPATSRAGRIRARGASGWSTGSSRNGRARPLRATLLARGRP